jgi:N utilization substance protein A
LPVKSDFLIAISQVCAERGLSKEVVLEAVEQALVSAYKRDFGQNTNISAKVDAETGKVHIYAEKQVVEEVTDDHAQISLAEATVFDYNAQVGGTIRVETTPNDFGRIATQAAKQVIMQRIREAERDALHATYAEREGEIINGTIQHITDAAITLNLGKAEAVLPRSEQIPTERYRLNQRLRVYVVEVEKTGRGPHIVVSRTNKNMLRRLLEIEVPEIYNGLVEIKSIAREPGWRSKVAVTALQDGIDPIGACVGMRGVRIQAIVNELNGEKIDVIEWNADPRQFIANALSPAPVTSVTLTEDGEGNKTAIVVVPDKQLSLAIGKEGQNARLAAKLTGWRIDIKSQSQAEEEARKRAEELAAMPVAAPTVEEEVVQAPAVEVPVEVVAAPTIEVPVEEVAVPAIEVPVAEVPTTEAAPVVPEIKLPEGIAEVWGAAETETEEETEEAAPKPKGKRKKSRVKRTLVFDEKLGEVVAKQVRKPSRLRDEWEAEVEETEEVE